MYKVDNLNDTSDLSHSPFRLSRQMDRRPNGVPGSVRAPSGRAAASGGAFQRRRGAGGPPRARAPAVVRAYPAEDQTHPIEAT